jgi:uncharacterized membrane protein
VSARAVFMASDVTTVGADASWIVVPVVVLVIVLVGVNALRAGRDGGRGGALQGAARAAPNAIVAVVGTVLVVVGGGATAVLAGLLPIMIVVEAVGGHVLGPMVIAFVVAIVALIAGAMLLGRGLRELVPWRR